MIRTTSVKKKLAGSCLTLCLTGALAWNVTSVSAWAAPSSGTAINDNTVVREAIRGAAAGSLTAGQEVTIHGEEKSDDGYTWYEVSFDWNGQETDGWVRSDLISAGGADAAATDNTADNHDDQAVTTNLSDQTVTPDSFSINGASYQVADNFPADQIPKGFSATTISYAGKDVPAAQMENGAQVVLLYLENMSDSQQKGVFVYDAERGEAIPFVSIAQQDSFVVVTNVPKDVAAQVSGRFQAGQCTFANGSIMAYQTSDTDDTVSADVSASEFYYVYGISSNGQSGWYVYDSVNQTLQRSMTNMQYDGSAAQDNAGDKAASGFDKDSMTRMITAGVGIVALLLLILLIVMSVRYRRLRKYLDNEVGMDDAEDEEEDEEEAIPTKTFEVELKGSKVDVMDFDSELENIDKKVSRGKKTAKAESAKEEQPQKMKKQEKEAAKDKTLKVQKTKSQPEKPQEEDNLEEILRNAQLESAKKAAPVETVKKEAPVETVEEIEAEIQLDAPKQKENSQETQQLVADLKKLIQEVENNTKEESNPEEAFIKEEEPEFFDEEEPEEVVIPEKTEKKAKKEKKDSWDDIEFL